MSKYSKWLEDYINEHPDFIMPEARKNEIINNLLSQDFKTYVYQGQVLNGEFL